MMLATIFVLILCWFVVLVIVGLRVKEASRFGKDANGCPVVWGLMTVPLDFDQGVDLAWRATFRGAVVRCNLAMGRHLLVILPGLSRTRPTGGILVIPGDSHGVQLDTAERYIVGATVTVPRLPDVNRMALAVQLLCGAIGLLPSDRTDSVMFEKVCCQTSPGVLAGEDAEALRAAYR